MPAQVEVPSGWSDLKTLNVIKGDKPVWQCYVHKLRTWVPSKETENLSEPELIRPYLILVVDTSTGTFLTTSSKDATPYGATNFIRSASEPSTSLVLSFLKAVCTHPRVMNASMRGTEPSAARPTKVLFADTLTAQLHRGQPEKWAEEKGCKYSEEGRAALDEVGIQTGFAPVPSGLLETVIRGQIEAAHQPEEAGTGALPGLRHTEGFTAEFGRSLFQAATDLYRADLWAKLPRRPIKVSYPIGSDDEGRVFKAQGFGLLVGRPGAEGGCGLALHKKEEAAWEALAAEGKAEGEAEGPAQACNSDTMLFLAPQELPFEDLDDMDLHCWPAPAPQALPLFCRLEYAGEEHPSGASVSISRPASLLDLMWFELAARTIAALAASGDLPLAAPDALEADLSMRQGPWSIHVDTWAKKGVESDILVDVECPAKGGAAVFL